MSGFSDVLSTVGTAVGSAFAGPVGGMVGGTLGDLAADAIDGSSSPSSPKSISSEAWGASPPTSQTWPGGLTTNGKNAIDTGRYLITFKDGEAAIFDKQTNTSVRAWGDPHLHTGDGDKAQVDTSGNSGLARWARERNTGTKARYRADKVKTGRQMARASRKANRR